MSFVDREPQIIAQTSEWLVVNKPSGWLTIAGRGLPESVPILLEWAQRQQEPKVFVVHRLDRETSGVILFALNEDAHKKANGWFQQRMTKKLYTCIAVGLPSAPIMKLKEPIEGAPSTTQVEVKDSFAEGFTASVRPLTGRRHQIRIHLAKKGHPLWGDSTYRGPKEIHFPNRTLQIDRVALHATELELPSGEKFVAPFPADFLGWLECLQSYGTQTW